MWYQKYEKMTKTEAACNCCALSIWQKNKKNQRNKIIEINGVIKGYRKLLLYSWLQLPWLHR